MRQNRRGVVIFFLVFGICLVALAVALNVGWILFSLERVALLVVGIIFFAAIITGLVLNTIFLIREIRRNERHDAFINSVTHELKTPIASLKLYLETLKTREVSEEQRAKFYDTMLADTERLNQTVEQVLMAGRSGDKQAGLSFSEFDLSGLLAGAAEIVRARHNLPEGAFNFAAPREIIVNGDAKELQSAFTNIFDNAVKYSDGMPVVSIGIRRLSSLKTVIRIADSGIGISPDDLKRIFKRFYRAPEIAGSRVKGTGLGLFIVRSIIERHGGRISAESKGPGKGAVFTIELPNRPDKG